MRDIAEWLASIGLGEYTQRFGENAIDLSVVGDLTEQDLKDLGLPLGHRRKMLRAIAELDEAALTVSQAPAKRVARDDAQRRQLRDDLRSRGLNGPFGAPRSGGLAQSDRGLSHLHR